MALRKSVTLGTLKEVQQAVPREMAYTKGIKNSIEKKSERSTKAPFRKFRKTPRNN